MFCSMSYRQKPADLASLCEIQTGYTARAKLKPSESGVPAIQLRDLRGEDEYDPAEAPRFALGESIDRYRAGAGDVLFRSRGEQNTAIAVKPESKSWAVAILPLLILRPRRDLLDPQYLAWFINQPTSQRYFDSCAYGQSLRMIPKPCLARLEIPLPDLKTQRLVVDIDRLARRESDLLGVLAEKRRMLTHLILIEQMQQDRPVDRTNEKSGPRKKAASI